VVVARELDKDVGRIHGRGEAREPHARVSCN
jgi:hypothetical protein